MADPLATVVLPICNEAALINRGLFVIAEQDYSAEVEILMALLLVGDCTTDVDDQRQYKRHKQNDLINDSIS